MPKNELPKTDKSENPEVEKYLAEKSNFIGLKNLYVFLKNTKDKGSEFQKQVLTDIFKHK